MSVYLWLPLPMAVIWIAITDNPTFAGLIVGYVLSLAIVRLFRPAEFAIRPGRAPGQVLALVAYLAILFRDIVLSSVDVARRVLSPDMRLKPGIIEVDTQDPQRNPVIAALSAQVITLTPGELVVELEEKHRMYVHCLDVEASAANADHVQSRRLYLLRRVIGRTG